jgi:hypothetical protein
VLEEVCANDPECAAQLIREKPSFALVCLLLLSASFRKFCKRNPPLVLPRFFENLFLPF